ncbi:MAG: hypothetical protein GY926_17265 [bacterium]|nr:hypothetical protein [bacterium]
MHSNETPPKTAPPPGKGRRRWLSTAAAVAIVVLAGLSWYRTTRHYEIGQALNQAHQQLDPTIEALDLPVTSRWSTRPRDANCGSVFTFRSCRESDSDGRVSVVVELPHTFTAPGDLPTLTRRMEQAGFELTTHRCPNPASVRRSWAAKFEIDNGAGVQMVVSQERLEDGGGLTASISAQVDHDTLELLPPSRPYAFSVEDCWTTNTH